jgi:site-specific DNA-methyltransferase (adenine-specific)
MKTFPDRSIDLVLTDPPYGVTQNEWDEIPDLSNMWGEIWRTLKEDGAVIMTSQQPFCTDLINSERDNFKYDLIWYKPLATGFLNANKAPLRNHEIILVFYKKLPAYNPQKFIGKIRKRGISKANSTTNYGSFKSIETKEHNDYFPQSVMEFSNTDKSNGYHPTQKPIDLMAYLIKTYSNENDLILDPFLGSGTTAVAAKQLHRRFIGIEISERYCQIARERLRQGILF